MAIYLNVVLLDRQRKEVARIAIEDKNKADKVANASCVQRGGLFYGYSRLVSRNNAAEFCEVDPPVEI